MQRADLTGWLKLSKQESSLRGAKRRGNPSSDACHGTMDDRVAFGSAQ
jgi:hypothetical protein